MNSVYELRRTNLRQLMGSWGGPTSLAKKLGHSNGSYIAQLAGPHPSREVRAALVLAGAATVLTVIDIAVQVL